MARRLLRLAALTLAAVVAGTAGYLLFTLPPHAQHLQSDSTPNVVYGAYHVHTNRSDGTGSPDEIADAAARAGLTFVIFTDHGDATRAADAPQYRHGVLCIDAVEIAT